MWVNNNLRFLSTSEKARLKRKGATRTRNILKRHSTTAICVKLSTSGKFPSGGVGYLPVLMEQNPT